MYHRQHRRQGVTGWDIDQHIEDIGHQRHMCHTVPDRIATYLLSSESTTRRLESIKFAIGSSGHGQVENGLPVSSPGQCNPVLNSGEDSISATAHYVVGMSIIRMFVIGL